MGGLFALGIAPKDTSFLRGVQPDSVLTYVARRAAYDIKKLRGKDRLSKLPKSRRYSVPQQAVPTIAALVIIREKLLRPILAGIRKPTIGHKPTNCAPIDQHYENVRQHMLILMRDLRIAA